MGSPRRRGRFSVSLVALATALVFIPGVPAAVGVDVIEVNCPGDSLQAAIEAAAPGSSIYVSGTCVETIVINKDLRLQGEATLDGDGDGRVVRIAPGARVTMEDFIVTGGAASRGAGILVDGAELTITDSTVRDNHASIAGGGMMLRNGAELSAHGLIVAFNIAGSNGGGILVKGAAAEITSSWILDNQANDGGGIANTRGSSTEVVATDLKRNSAARYGGGLFNAGSDAWLTATAIAGNQAASRGGGFANIRGEANGRVFVTNSTIAMNSAPRGSGIDNLDVFVALDHSTITRNSGSPAFYEDKSPPWTTPINSIIAGNHNGDCFSSLHSGGGNVVGDCVFRDIDGGPGATPTDLLSIFDPGLRRLGDDPASYYEPYPSSPAIDLIPPADCTQSWDQRARSRPVGDGCDSGAVEAPINTTNPTIELDFEFGHVFNASPVVLSGTATDDEEIWKVTMAVKDRDEGLWLQSDLVTWGNWDTIQLELDSPNSPVTTFSLALDLDPGNYSLAARAVDFGRRSAEVVPYRHFVVAGDTTPPVVDADYAKDTQFESPVLLSGIAFDNLSVDRVLIAVRNRSTGLWLQADETTWNSQYHGFTPATSGLGEAELIWSLGLALDVGIYSTSVRAQDSAGNWGNLVPWRRFEVVSEAQPLFVDSGLRLGNSQTMDIVSGDFDGDGDEDVYAANGQEVPNLVWQNDGSGGYTDSGQQLGNLWSWGADAADFDLDGDLDVAVANYAYGPPDMVWLNDGDGTFSDSGSRLGDTWSLDVATGDLDGNGTPDLFVGAWAEFRVWLGDGSGGFVDQGPVTSLLANESVALGDLDGDGSLDAFLGIHNWPNPLPNRVWMNDGDGTFTATGQALGFASTLDVALGDLDGDGDLDAFVANHQPNEVWLNDGSGNFVDSGQRLGNLVSAAVALGDVDGDGDLDAFTADHGPDRVWLNDGSGTFFDSGWRLGDMNGIDVALIDVDDDGDLDVWVGNDGPNYVWLNATNQ